MGEFIPAHRWGVGGSYVFGPWNVEAEVVSGQSNNWRFLKLEYVMLGCAIQPVGTVIGDLTFPTPEALRILRESCGRGGAERSDWFWDHIQKNTKLNTQLLPSESGFDWAEFAGPPVDGGQFPPSAFGLSITDIHPWRSGLTAPEGYSSGMWFVGPVRPFDIESGTREWSALKEVVHEFGPETIGMSQKNADIAFGTARSLLGLAVTFIFWEGVIIPFFVDGADHATDDERWQTWRAIQDRLNLHLEDQPDSEPE